MPHARGILRRSLDSIAGERPPSSLGMGAVPPAGLRPVSARKRFSGSGNSICWVEHRLSLAGSSFSSTRNPVSSTRDSVSNTPHPAFGGPGSVVLKHDPSWLEHYPVGLEHDPSGLKHDPSGLKHNLLGLFRFEFDRRPGETG